MRDYGKVYSRFWTSRDVRSLSEDARYLALYLLTCKHCTLIGIQHLPDGYVCDDMQWTAERVTRAFSELERKGFATRCPETKWVWITKHLEWNGLDTANHAKHAYKILDEVPTDCCWLADFQKVLDDYIAAKSEDFHKSLASGRDGIRKGSRTVPGRLPIPSEGHPDAMRMPSEGHADAIPIPSERHPHPVTVTVSVSESVTVPVTETEPVHASSADAAGECVRDGEEKIPRSGNGASHGTGNGHDPASEANGHDPPDPPPSPGDPKGFAMLRQLYPDRAGSQRWGEALVRYQRNLKGGYTDKQMLDGVIRYARYCAAEGITGTKYVQAAVTFLGDDLGFLQNWKPSGKPKRESPAERWAREEMAKDAAKLARAQEASSDAAH